MYPHSPQCPHLPILSHLWFLGGQALFLTTQKTAPGILPQTEYTEVPTCDSCCLLFLLMQGDRYNQGSFPNPSSEAHPVPPAGMSLLLVAPAWHCFIFQKGNYQSSGDEVPGPFSLCLSQQPHLYMQIFLPRLKTETYLEGGGAHKES